MEDIFVGQLMSSPVQTVQPATPIHDAASQMLAYDIGSLVVVDETDQPEGILTSTDFVRLASDEASPAETAVETYMNPVTVSAGPSQPIRDVADIMMEHGVHHLPVVEQEAGVLGILTTTDLTAYLSHDWVPSPD